MLENQGMSHQMNFNNSEHVYKSKERDEKLNPIQNMRVGHQSRRHFSPPHVSVKLNHAKLETVEVNELRKENLIKQEYRTYNIQTPGSSHYLTSLEK